MDHTYKGIGENRITLFIYFALQAIVLLMALTFVGLGLWDKAITSFLILLLMLAPSFVKKRYQIYLPFILDFYLVVFIFLTLFLGDVQRFYDHVPFWDKLLHFQSGFLMGSTGYLLVYLLNEYKREELNLNPGFLSFFAVIFSLALGVTWEIVEFGIDVILGTSLQGGLHDTMMDLVYDFSGALITSIFGYFWMYRHKRLPFTPWFLKLLREEAKQGAPLRSNGEGSDRLEKRIS